MENKDFGVYVSIRSEDGRVLFSSSRETFEEIEADLELVYSTDKVPTLRKLVNNLNDEEEKTLNQLKETLGATQEGPVEPAKTKTDLVCGDCGAPLVERQGKYGPFFGCSRFPNCKFIKRK